MSRQQSLLESSKKTKRPRTDCDSEGSTSSATEEILTPDSQVDLEDQSEESTFPNELVEFEVIHIPSNYFPKGSSTKRTQCIIHFSLLWFVGQTVDII